MADAPRSGRILAASLTLLAAIWQTGCVILPVKVAPTVAGVVRDGQSGAAIAGALVAVRYAARYDNVLPDRDVLGYQETETDEQGHFRLPPMVRPGLSLWPYLQTEVRVSVMAAGFECSESQVQDPRGGIAVELTPATSDDDRRNTCRPVALGHRAAPTYTAAWQALHSHGKALASREDEAQLEQLLSARAQLGHGENCEGPVLDLALAPGGERAAWIEARDGTHAVYVRDLIGPETSHAGPVAELEPTADRRLAWTHATELATWEPVTDRSGRSLASIFGGRLEVVWTAPSEPSLPAAPAPWVDPSTPDVSAALEPSDPADWNDENDSQWLGRSFALARVLDPDRGLPRDVLTITDETGAEHVVNLPGEACGPRARFGRPHYRIAADGRTGLDLRWIDGACHAVRIDFTTGAVARLDGSAAAGTCRDEERIPAAHLGTALRGWMRDLESNLVAAGADPTTGYVLRIDPTAGTSVDTRDLAGAPLRVMVPAFPVDTPLRKIHVSVVGTGAAAPAPTIDDVRPVTGRQPL